MPKKNALRYRLRIQGVWGRNRTIHFETFDFDRVDADKPLTLDVLMPKVRETLARIKFKWGSVQLEEQPVEVDTYEMGGRTHEAETYTLFSNKTLHSEKIEKRE